VDEIKKMDFDITKIDEELFKNEFFYKEREINEDNFSQRFIVTYSLKYRNHQREIRSKQVERAEKAVEKNPSKIKRHRPTDYKRFVEVQKCTNEGEVAEKEIYNIDTKRIEDEAAFDGFYGVCTNLDDAATEIAKIAHRRWEIEECFRILKSEFKARPVHLQNDNRIIAHFVTCFMALLMYRLLEKRLKEEFTCCEIVAGLKDFNFYKVVGEGYVPTYTRNDFTDALHDAFGFRTDFEIVNNKQMKTIFKKTKG
jgi:transposase